MHFNAENLTVALLERLIAAQFPRWAGLPITPVRSARPHGEARLLGDVEIGYP